MNAEDESQQATTNVPTQTLREWVAACDPLEPLNSSDRRYFDLGKTLRGEYETELLLDPIKLIPESCQLFSGFAGTGKSTELRELARTLEERGYSVLLVDAKHYHDLSRELNVVDLLVVIAGAFGEATGRRLGKDVVTAGYWQRLIDFLKQEVGVSEAKLGIAIGDLKVGIREELPFWLNLRRRLSQSLGKLHADAHGFVRGCVERIRRAEPRSRGVVFIMDSMEKVNPPLGKFREVMERKQDPRQFPLWRWPGSPVEKTRASVRHRCLHGGFVQLCSI